MNMPTLIAVLIYIYFLQIFLVMLIIVTDIGVQTKYKTIKTKYQLLLCSIPVVIWTPFAIYKIIKHIKELE